jgi:hypothetical protein
VIPDVPGIDDLLGWATESATNSVFDGIVSWMARGLAMLIEWIWTTLDSATTPRISEPWFATDLVGPVGLLALAVVVALMLASAIQAALAGRPEQIGDAFKQAAWSLVATGLSITVIDLLLGVVDAASAAIWGQVRPDLQRLLEGVITAMSASAMNGMGFLAVLMMLFMYLALIGLAVALAMRNALIYVAAFLAPLVFASSVLPLFRESARKIVHLLVALIVSKLAIVATLTVAVKMMANATDLSSSGDLVQDGVGSLGVLFAGVVCFAVASITPMVLYKLMPTVEGAVVGAGIAGGWGRSAMTGMYAASTAKGLGGALTKLSSGPVPSGGSSGARAADRTQAGPSSAAPSATSATGGKQSSTAGWAPSGVSAVAGGAPAAAGPGGAGSAGTAGSVAGAVAVPVVAATSAVGAAVSAGERTGRAAEQTLDASAGGQPSAQRPATPSTRKEGPPGPSSATESEATRPVRDGKER